MSAPNVRKALSLLPPCATTGIGSLPHTQLEMGLQMGLQVEIPYLPQLAAGTPSELMIPAALDGLPGLQFDGEGVATVDLPAWEAARDAFALSIETALQSDHLDAFEPSPQASRAFRPFLWEVENRKLALAKVQIAGPCTVRWVARTSDGRPASDIAALDQQIFRLLLAKSLALVKAVRRAGATPLLYLDEPGLYALDRRDARHLVALQELRMLVVALRREGALVGLHCCSNTDWPAVLELGLDLVSLDVRLSLDALLEDREAFRKFLATGATLSLGIIPTDLTASYSVRELVDSVEASLRATLGSGFASFLSHVLLTPACGLAMRSVMDAERIFSELREAQRLVRRLVEAEAPPPAPEARA
jgi:methionine synthase II (cobalamin-independent)